MIGGFIPKQMNKCNLQVDYKFLFLGYQLTSSLSEGERSEQICDVISFFLSLSVKPVLRLENFGDE